MKNKFISQMPRWETYLICSLIETQDVTEEAKL